MGEINLSKLVGILNRKDFPDVERTFYRDMKEYMDSLQKELEGAKTEGDEHGAKEIERKIEKAKRYYEKIYYRRVEAILSLVTQKVRLKSTNVNLSKFTPEESDMFHKIMALVENKKNDLFTGKKDLLVEPEDFLKNGKDEKKQIIGNKDAETPDILPTIDEEDRDIEDKDVEKENPPGTRSMKKGQYDADSPKEAAYKNDIEEIKKLKTERKKEKLITIRVLGDGKFVNIDGTHTYIIKKGDTANIDKTLANLLVEMSKAEKIEPRW